MANKSDKTDWKSIAQSRGRQIIDLGHEIKKLEGELAQCRKDHTRTALAESSYRDRNESLVKRNKSLHEDLAHQQRLVRTLTDALADKYHPLPTNINVQMSYRVAGEVKEGRNAD